VTCIVGLVQDGVVWMAGDSAASEGDGYLTRTLHPKVFRNGAWTIGYTSSFRMGQLLQYSDLPEPDGLDLCRFMVTVFVERVRTIMRTGGYMRCDHGAESGGIFLVGVAGRLFHFDSDFNVLELGWGFDAVGIGISVARGSLYSTQGAPPEMRLRLAMEAAEQFATGVRAPFHVIADDWPEPREMVA
jgi:hypothetical protein